jgi:hypothetical protein
MTADRIVVKGMTADRIVDILLDAVDTKFMQNFVSGSFSVRLQGVLRNHWSGASCCDAILYGDGRLKLLNENKDVVFKTKHFYLIKSEPGYYGTETLGRRFFIRTLERMYPNLIGHPIRVYATTKDPKFEGRGLLEYTGQVQKR